MAGFRFDVNPEDVRQSARHVLFVEGHGNNPFDQEIIQTLLSEKGINIRVQALTSGTAIGKAAEAFHAYHRTYYFLIDRDCNYTDKVVEKSWTKFPNPDTNSLLIWRKRELENYFLEPEFLLKSSFVNCEADFLRELILNLARQRLFMDVTNFLILGLWRDLNNYNFKPFKQVTDFSSKDDALRLLLSLPEIKTRKAQISKILGQRNLQEKFENLLDDFSGGSIPLEYGKGNWLQFVDAKIILNQIVDRCFRAKTRAGKFLKGGELLQEVSKALVRLPLTEQPTDFQDLCTLIGNQIKKQ